MKTYSISEKHSRTVRWTHWMNVPLLIMMMWSGVLIYWADQAFLPLPNFLVNKLQINHRLAEGMGWHFFIMWPFALNGLIYVTYLLLTSDWKTRKYNPLQRTTYLGVIGISCGSIISGLAIYKPVQLGWLTELLGGYESARFFHFWSMMAFFLFIPVHLIQVARSGWKNLRAMIAGYVIEKD